MASKKYDLIAGGTSAVTGTATFDEAARSISMSGTLPIAAGGGGGGAADLSAIAEDVLPADDNTYDLGSAAKRFAEVHIETLIVSYGADETLRFEIDANHVIGYTSDATSGFTGYGKTVAAQPAWWDGAASVIADVGLTFRSRDSSPHSRIEMFVSDDQNDYATVYLDSDYGFYPDTNNKGSLGIAGKTWAGLFATLPSSDPGGNGMWVNAANHNAVTIGDGS